MIKMLRETLGMSLVKMESIERDEKGNEIGTAYEVDD